MATSDDPPSNGENRHWSEDPYWVAALDAFSRRRAKGVRFLTIDLDAVEKVAFNGDGPAYRLMEAMCGVKRQEGLEGYKGAPRVLLALLMRLAEVSGSTSHISPASRGKDNARRSDG